MYIAELWRYPVKSLAGETLQLATLTADGIEGDRVIHVRGPRGVLTARTRHRLLGLMASTGLDGTVSINGRPWYHPTSAREIHEAAGPFAQAVPYNGPERFDVLPLLVATDGAISTLGCDARRLRPNIVIGGVAGLAERSWPGKALKVGGTLIGIRKLRSRCIVTTIDPDTGQQDLDILRSIQQDFDGTFALDCWVAQPGVIHVGDHVEIVDANLPAPQAGGWIVGAPYVVN